MEAQFLRIRGRERIYPVSRLNQETQEVVIETEVGEMPFPLTSVEFISLEDLKVTAARKSEYRSYPTVDLHGRTVAEGLDELDRAIENALAAGANKLLVIHGKGTGVLRQAVWDYLRQDARVGRFGLDHMSYDGTGATIAELV